MSGNKNNTLNNTVETPENSFSKNPLWQKIESLEKEIKSLRKQNRLNSGIIGLGVIGLIGYIIATNWSAIAPASATAATATATATVAAAPVIGIVIGAIIGAAVLVGASYAAWRYRAEIKAGFKYAAEKTVEGAKHTAGKIKAGAVYAKDSVKEGYENSVDSLERGAGKVKSAIGSALETVGHKISSTGEDMNTSYKLTDSTDTGVLLLTEDGKKEYNSIRNALRNISDKHLLEKMSSEMVSLIDSKIESEKNMIDFQNKGNLHKSEALISRWIKQKNSIVELDPKGLQKRLSYEGYDHDLYQIFSEHHNEIKKVISQCKREYEFDQSVKRNNAKDEEERKASKFSLFSSLGGKGSTQSRNSEVKVPLQEPFSSDFGVRDENDKFSPPSSGESTPTSGFSKPVDGKALEKKLKEIKKSSSTYRSNSPNSGRDSSGFSTPTRGQSPIALAFGSVGGTDLPNPLTPGKFATIGQEPSGKNPIPAAPPKVPKEQDTSLEKEWTDFVQERMEQHKLSASRSNSPDSGRGSSGSSTPTGRQSPVNLGFLTPIPVMLTDKGGRVKTQDDLKKTGLLDGLVEQTPSSKFDNANAEEQTIPKTV